MFNVLAVEVHQLDVCADWTTKEVNANCLANLEIYKRLPGWIVACNINALAHWYTVDTFDCESRLKSCLPCITLRVDMRDNDLPVDHSGVDADSIQEPGGHVNVTL